MSFLHALRCVTDYEIRLSSETDQQFTGLIEDSSVCNKRFLPSQTKYENSVS